MDDYRAILKRVGVILIAVGVLDIGVMIYCIANGIGYSSNLNIFAVIAGVFLCRGSLAAARVVAWFCAFYFLFFAVFVIFFAVFFGPLALWVTEFRLYPMMLSISTLTLVAVLALLAWTYRELRSAPVLQARLAVGLNISLPKFAIVLPVAFLIFGVGLEVYTQRDGRGEKAIEKARAQYGDAYQYHLNGMGFAAGHDWANVTAFNDHEIKTIRVDLP